MRVSIPTDTCLFHNALDCTNPAAMTSRARSSGREVRRRERTPRFGQERGGCEIATTNSWSTCSLFTKALRY